MNSKNANKQDRIINAEKNLERRLSGTTIKGHPDKITRPHQGNGKRRNHKIKA